MKIRCRYRKHYDLFDFVKNTYVSSRFHDGRGTVLQNSNTIISITILKFNIEIEYNNFWDKAEVFEFKKLLGEKTCLGCGQRYTKNETKHHAICLTSEEAYKKWLESFSELERRNLK